MGKQDDEETTVSVHSVDGPWTPNASRTWGNDVADPEKTISSWAWTWGIRTRWNTTMRVTKAAVTPAVRATGQTLQPMSSRMSLLISCSLWPFLVRASTAKKHWIALVLFLCGGVTPMALLGYFTPKPYYPNGAFPYYNVFAAKYMTCGNDITSENPANSTVTGFEGLFVLDQTYGRYSFATVKTIDVLWDIFLGRTVQALAWGIGYVVFSDALLRLIERHPASFRIFQRIALEGPSLLSLWTLCGEVWSINSKRSKALFAYILLSTTYILSIPMFLGAMTGYDSTSISWIDLDDSNNIVPSSALKYSWVIFGTMNSTFDKPVCKNTDERRVQTDYFWFRPQECTCQLRNGTLAPPGTYNGMRSTGFTYSKSGEWSYDKPGEPCVFNYPGANGTFEDKEYDYNPDTGSTYKTITHNCNETVMYQLNEVQYDVQNLNATTTYCYDGRSYDYEDLRGKSRCLPDTSNPSYQWGFSTMLSGIFVFIHFGWSISMYIVWLDAQARSVLIQEGYEMTPLRAAFAIAKAVKRKTGLGEGHLVRHDTRDLDKKLDGSRKQKGVKIEYSIFAPELDPENGHDDAREVRRRRALVRDGVAVE